jgi:hypothetical protein
MSDGARGAGSKLWWMALAPLAIVAPFMLPAFVRYGAARWEAYTRPPQAPSTVVPVAQGPKLDGSPVDLSTVMGRARKLADAWHREATLLGIEATLRDGKIETGEGATAQLVFGPSSFGGDAEHRGWFVVTYDKSGLSTAEAAAGSPRKALPEPMCAPEHVVSQLARGNAAVFLRYTFDEDERPLWLVGPPTEPARVRAFDAHDCRVRGIVVPPRH